MINVALAVWKSVLYAKNLNLLAKDDLYEHLDLFSKCRAIFYIFMLALLTFAGLTLLYQIKTKYNFAYQNQKLQLLAFLFTELVGFTILVVLNWTMSNKEQKVRIEDDIEYIYIYSGLKTSV
jgi:hypothetical protein